MYLLWYLHGVREQVYGVSGLPLPLHEFQGLHSSCQACMASVFTISAILQAPRDIILLSLSFLVNVSVPAINIITKNFYITEDYMPRGGSALTGLYPSTSINNKDNLQKYGHMPILS